MLKKSILTNRKYKEFIQNIKDKVALYKFSSDI